MGPAMAIEDIELNQDKCGAVEGFEKLNLNNDLPRFSRSYTERISQGKTGQAGQGDKSYYDLDVNDLKDENETLKNELEKIKVEKNKIELQRDKIWISLEKTALGIDIVDFDNKKLIQENKRLNQLILKQNERLSSTDKIKLMTSECEGVIANNKKDTQCNIY